MEGIDQQLLFGMRIVGIRVLKNKLSRYVHLAAAGETVLVTDRGRVVAELGPPRPERAEAPVDVQLAEGVGDGWRSPHVADGVPPRLPVPPLAHLLAELDQDRADR